MKFGLLGHPLSHSYSGKLFRDFFRNEKHLSYELFDYESLDEFMIRINRMNDIAGFNVTIPYKVSIMRYLDYTTDTATSVGACNLIKVYRDSEKLVMEGHNSDADGFRDFIENDLNLNGNAPVFILGSGGSAKAVNYVLQHLGFNTCIVTRSSDHPEDHITYDDLEKKDVSGCIIINCTPVGMHPESNELVNIPYDSLDHESILIDLVYNPGETRFLKMGKKAGARTYNGSSMLKYQAKRSWEYWGLI